MKERLRPKIFCKYDIEIKHKVIGFIQLVSYLCGDDIPHIEYELNEEYRNQGIMTKELPKYLNKYCKKYNHNRLVACVKKDNFHSIKILEQNGFAKVTEIRDNSTYAYSTDFEVQKVLKTINKLWSEEEYKLSRRFEILNTLIKVDK